jgi:uncharacterized protein YodC (DUF2158 family)
MADETFKAGDTVELKSGSPIMTIVLVTNDKYAICTWYDKATSSWKENIKFPTVILKVATPGGY